MLEARGLAVSHSGRDPVLDRLDLRLVPGELVALTGPNGSGKTTLCLALAGLLEPLRGEVRLDGVHLESSSRSRQDVGIVFQEPEAQLVTGSVETEIAFPLENLGWDRTSIDARVADLVRDLDLGRFATRSLHELSGGERSRVALAAALASSPRYLLLDEPGVYLGPHARKSLREILRREVERGLGVLLVTQLEEEWAEADRWLRLRGGRLVEDRSKQPIELAETERREGRDREIDLKSARAPGSPGDPVLVARGLRFSYSAPDPSSGNLIDDLDLEVRRGETVWIEGESGSGKTTLLHLLAGVLEPLAGSVRTRSRGAEAPIEMAIVLQSPEDQILSSTIREDAEMGPRGRRLSPEDIRTRAEQALELAGLAPALYDFPPSSLSHGERRRAAWAGAWALAADLWLLDEPTAGLDRPGVLALENALARHSSNGGAAIVVSQDPRLESWTARRMRLVGGKIHSYSTESAHERAIEHIRLRVV